MNLDDTPDAGEVACDAVVEEKSGKMEERSDVEENSGRMEERSAVEENSGETEETSALEGIPEKIEETCAVDENSIDPREKTVETLSTDPDNPWVLPFSVKVDFSFFPDPASIVVAS